MNGTATLERNEAPEVKPLVDKKLEEFVQELETKLDSSRVEKERDAPKRTVLRREKDWSRWGWNETEKKDARNKLITLFEWEEGTDEKKKYAEARAENALELMLANNKTYAQVIGDITDGLGKSEQKVKEDRKGDDDKKLERPLNYEEKLMAKIYFLNGLGVESQDTIKRFVLTEEFRHDNQAEYDRQTPSSLNELAWQIAHKLPKDFGVNGRYPVLQIELTQDSQGNVTGKYQVNQANFMRWMRKNIMFHYDKSPDDFVNYFDAVKLDKDFRPVTLGDITDNMDRFFKDDDGKVHTGLYNQMLKEVLTLFYIRQYDLEYKQIMSNGPKLTEKLSEMYYKNKITKNSFGKNFTYIMSTLPLDYDEGKNDDTMGAAFNTLLLAYYNIADFKNLQKVLGEDSSFFTKEGMFAAIEKVVESKYGDTLSTREGMMKFLGEDAKKFDEAFDGNVAKEKEFTAFINYFGTLTPGSNLVLVVKQALKNAVAQRYNFVSSEQNEAAVEEKNGKKDLMDSDSLDMAWLIASSWIRFSGAGARSDTNNSFFDVSGRWFSTEAYRRKMATEKRGNAFGNPYTVPMFKSVGVDFMNGMRVSEAYKEVIDPDHKTVVKDDKGDVMTRKKSLLEVFEEMNKLKIDQTRKLKILEAELTLAKSDPELYKQKKDELEQKKKEFIDASHIVAGQLEFNDNAMVNYVNNHLNRGQKVYEQIMGAKQIEFEKFTKFDSIRGLTFDRSEFQKQVQEEFLKPVRYLFDTFGEINFNMMISKNTFIRRDGDRDIYEFRDMPLGEALFGYQILNIPQYRKLKQDKDGNKIRGRYMRDPNTGRYIIDYNEVQRDSTTAYKQWALMKLGADLWTHIDRHSTDPGYNIGYYYNVLDAIASIPGEIDGDDEKMRDVRITKAFFDKKQMKWLRQISGTTNYRLFWKGIFDDLAYKSDQPGVSDSLGLFLGAIFRGY